MAQTGTSSKNAYGYIDQMLISKGWKAKFKMIYIAYYQNFYFGGIKSPLFWKTGPQIQELPFLSKLRFDTRTNIWALFFGPLYYICKGMFLKGIILLAATAALIFYRSDTTCFIPLIFLYCGFSADIDYFNAKFLKLPEFNTNPAMLSDYYDKYYMAKITSKKLTMPLLKIAAMLVVFLWGITLAFQFYESKQTMKYFNNIEQVCKDTQGCKDLSSELIAKIKGNENKNSGNLYYKLGCAQYLLGNKKKSLDYFSQAKVENPDNIKPYAAAAIVYNDLGSYKSAIKNYQAILKIDPKITFTYYYIGRTYYKIRDYRRALECFEVVTKEFPNEPIYLEAQAYTKIYLRDISGAKSDIEKTIKLLEKESKTKNALKIENLRKYIQAMR